MFESIRNNRWLALIVMLPIFLFFVISGVYGFMQFRDTDAGVAKVDGVAITAQELEAAHRDRTEQYRQMLGPNFDSALFDTPRMRAATLESVISDRTLERAVVHDRIEVGNDQLRDSIRTIPAFQRDGKFDYASYKSLLQSRGFSEAGFEQRMRDDLGKQTLVRGVEDSAFLPNAIAQHMWQLSEEQRTVRLQRFAPADFAARASNAVAADSDAVEAYYKTHQSEFATPETVKADYLVLSLDDVAAQVTVAPADVKTYYDQNQSRFTLPEERHAFHILLPFDRAAPASKDSAASAASASKDAARKKADELVQRLRANPGDFAKLAREYSKDPGSADKGGDLGWFGRGMMVKPFEDAAFALRPGETSGVVESDFGFHIIRVTEVRGGGVKPFEDARAGIEADLRREEAQKIFAQSAEQFTNLVYEQADSLQPAAERFKLKVQTVESLTRSGLAPAPGAPKVFGAALTGALFSADSLAKKHNVAAVEIGPNALASARVVEYRPSAVRALSEVRADIKAKLELAEATRLARAAGEQRLKELQAKADDVGFEAPIEVSREQPHGLPAAALAAVMGLAVERLPGFAGAELDGGAYGVMQVVAVNNPDKPDEKRRASERKSWDQATGAADEDSLVQGLRRRYGARVLKPELVAATASPNPLDSQ